MTKLRAAPLLLSAVFTITLVAPHKALAYSGLAAAQYADEHSLSCSSYWPCLVKS